MSKDVYIQKLVLWNVINGICVNSKVHIIIVLGCMIHGPTQGVAIFLHKVENGNSE